MKRSGFPFTVPIFFALLLAGLLPLGGCQNRQATAELTIAVNAGVEGDALKAAAADFLPACLAVCRHPYQSGQLFALPYVGNSQLFFYRRDLFDKYELEAPATWSEVLRAARVISEGEAGLYGYVMRAAQGNAVVADFMPLLW
ncbi:MAG: extracellular solute-binding protein, partial [Candidatus Brocadiales bacterium]|nr:extracellular solute-binding protein [Candidatus Bathyanammoxibius sp.]